MNPRQHELARIALHTVGRRGFVLGGGHAVALHGMSTRPSKDVDLFSDIRRTPGDVADDVIRAFETAGPGPGTAHLCVPRRLRIQSRPRHVLPVPITGAT